MVEHVDIPDGQIHEPKGISGALDGQVYVADGANSGAWATLAFAAVGWWDYNDLTTTSTPISLTSGVASELTNDGAGAFTNKAYALDGVLDVWDNATDRFDFTGLTVGDTIDIRIDISLVASSANDNFSLDMELGLGASPYTLNLGKVIYKSSGTYQYVTYSGVYLGDTNTLNNPARLTVTSDTTGDSVTVNGWYVRVIKRG